MMSSDFLLHWSSDGSTELAFLAVLIGLAAIYLQGVRLAGRRDRRKRRWPRRRTACFLGGIGVLIVDLYSGIGSLADSRLSAHMVEHMLIWLAVAPLMAAGAPIRLALRVLARPGRRRLARVLHGRLVRGLASPLGSASVFSLILLTTHIPPVYDLALQNDYAHGAEHGAYLAAALIMWAPLLGVDPLPRQPHPRDGWLCLTICMAAMGLVAAWLGLATHPFYQHYASTTGAAALGDQRLAAVIMLIGGLPAFAIPALRRRSERRPQSPEQRRAGPKITDRGASRQPT